MDGVRTIQFRSSQIHPRVLRMMSPLKRIRAHIKVMIVLLLLWNASGFSWFSGSRKMLLHRAILYGMMKMHEAYVVVF